jgi:hypothetical protein
VALARISFNRWREFTEYDCVQQGADLLRCADTRTPRNEISAAGA